jgi:hypothetical protein
MDKKLLPNGGKARQRPDTTDRSLPYRDMRRTLDTHRTPIAYDADQLEMVRTKDGWKCAAFLELTLREQVSPDGKDWGPTPGKEYLDRYEQRDHQGDLARAVAGLMGCPAYLVVFNDDASHFWVHDLNSAHNEWYHTDRVGYERFLERLRDRVLQKTGP